MELARQCILRRARGHEQRGSGHVRDCYPGWANGHQRDYRAQPGLIASMRESVFFRLERGTNRCNATLLRLPSYDERYDQPDQR